jgi:hypothetical protein
MFADPEYYARPLARNEWQLAKFEGGKAPKAVYHLQRINERWECDCPGALRHHHCKHPAMLRDFIERRRALNL